MGGFYTKVKSNLCLFLIMRVVSPTELFLFFFGHYVPIILFKINRYVNIFKIYRIRQKAAVFLKKILRPLQPTKMM